MPKRLLVYDGPDKGQAYVLPDAGTVRIGASRKSTDICLHDLFVAKVHCQVDVGDGRVTVCDQITPNGILVNGAKVTQQELRLGDIVRVGNSYLRLEEAEDTASGPEVTAPAQSGPAKFCHLPLARLGESLGQILGHYEIGDLIARGHSGVVFRARDEKTDQSLALKVLAPVFPADDAEMQQFVRAMKSRMAVTHPGLVALRGAGKSGLYVWIATDLVEGESVASVLRHWHGARKHKWLLALRVGLQLVRVVEHLRQFRLVHSNITPANVLLPHGDGPARLNDLGHWDALLGSELQQQTWERKFLAEVPYLSPEHVDPDVRADDLSDQYCIGAVVYALLTGRPPFEGETPEGTIELIRAGRPARPKEIQRTLPDAFQAIVLRMLARHPEERYPSAALLVADLERIATEYDDEE